MSKKNIVILGCGYAGIQTALDLNKIFRKNFDISITLVDKNDFHSLITELHEVAGYRVEEESVQVSIKHILQYTKINFIHNKIENVDLNNKTVILTQHELHYDYLVIALGSEPFSFNIPGVKEYAFNLWSIEDAIKIKKQVIRMFELARDEKDTNRRKELLTFVVCGGGLTGVEMMGELMQWTKFLAREYKIHWEEVKLILVEALPKLCYSLKDNLSRKIRYYLERKGVQVETEAAVTEVTDSSVTLKNGKIFKTHTLIWTSGIQANSIVKEWGLKLTKRNRIEINKYMQCVDRPEVYAIGDNAFALDEKGEDVGQFVEAALQTASVAAQNIANDITGNHKKVEFKPNFHGILVSIGSTYAVADIMGIQMSGILAVAMKHLVNLHYLWGIGGIEICIQYLQHHFLARTRRKPLLIETSIDHFNAKSRTYWLVIPRIFLGLVWLSSAFEKIEEGWLSAGDKLISGATLQLIGPNTPEFYAWFVENIIYRNPLLFQTLITLTELFCAITLISGAFTFIGAVAAIVMNINFFLSGTSEPYLMLAHIPMLAGAGRAFGLDHYIMPYIMRLVRKWQRR